MDIVNKVLGLFLGNKYERDIREITPYTIEILKEYDKLKDLSNDQLRDLTGVLKIEILNEIEPDENEIKSLKGKAEAEEDVYRKEEYYNEIDKIEKLIDEKLEKKLDTLIPRAFALVKETARRFKENSVLEVTAKQYDRDLAATRESISIKGDKAIWSNRWIAGGNEIVWDMVHYDVQLIGGVALHKGKIAEMGTGEGKTVVATLPVFLNALAGRGVHIVTVNDYLAKRDSEWMGPIYEFHGLSVDCIDKHQPNSESRRKAYHADITFGTNNEFGFDYLRDNMALSPQDLVQRKHHYAIVDEVDSVLIDDARTPLIISGPVPQGENQQFLEFKPKVQRLVDAQRKLVNQVLADARKALENNNNEKGGCWLLQAYKGLPKTTLFIVIILQ